MTNCDGNYPQGGGIDEWPPVKPAMLRRNRDPLIILGALLYVVILGVVLT